MDKQPKKKSKIPLILAVIAVVGFIIYIISARSKDDGNEEGIDAGNPEPTNCFTPDPGLTPYSDPYDSSGAEWIKQNHDFGDDIKYVIAWFKLVGLQTKPAYANRYIKKIKAYVASEKRLPHWEVIAFSKACGNTGGNTNPFLTRRF